MHERQVPAQAVAQHTPCWQNVDAHSDPAPQAVPDGLRPQAPLVQTFPGAQSASLVHVDLQAVAPQAKAPHGVDAAGRQVPIPSQVRAGVAAPMLQAADAHVVPLAILRQAPAPSQLPSLPQVETATEGH